MFNFEVFSSFLNSSFKIGPARSCLLAITAQYVVNYTAVISSSISEIELWQAGIQDSITLRHALCAMRYDLQIISMDEETVEF